MRNDTFYQTLCGINGAENVLLDEPMRQHTTFRIGGPARFFCRPGSAPQLKDTIAACDDIVRIPMSHGVDSLNVAAASAVAFWQLGRRKEEKGSAISRRETKP